MFLETHWGKIKPPVGVRHNPVHNLSRGLVGHWIMNENGSGILYDISGNGNNGTLTSGPTWTQGQFGPALNFDGGDDYVNVGDINALDGLAALSVSGRFRFNNVSTNYVHYLDKSNSSNGWTFQTGGIDIGSAGGPLVIIGAGIGFPLGYINSSVLIANVWVTLCFVYDGAGATNADRLKIYVNGVPAALNFSGTIPPIMTASAANLTLAQPTSNMLDDAYFDGQIDDVRVYNRVLTGDEIKRLYNLGR
ncbi:MAG: LamG domain-containing protein [Armatimonadota bacterium]|nr:LamG domain-containing protein [Armatimonadota bacterium]